MSYSIKTLAFLALSTGFASIAHADTSGSGGKTTRYWDCCKGSCSWPDKGPVSSPVKTCNANDEPLNDPLAVSGCDGGEAHMCSDQSPWAVSADMAYGFAAVKIPNITEEDWCCGCYELTFTSGRVKDKKMIVQATNTGGDLGNGHFDIAMPGGGVGIFNACTDQWGAPANGWGKQYGGIETDQCSSFPSPLQPGCDWRFGDFFENADNPDVDWKKVTCPKALTDKSGCVRNDETPTENNAAASSPEASDEKVEQVATSANSPAPAEKTTTPASDNSEDSSEDSYEDNSEDSYGNDSPAPVEGDDSEPTTAASTSDAAEPTAYTSAGDDSPAAPSSSSTKADAAPSSSSTKTDAAPKPTEYTSGGSDDSPADNSDEYPSESEDDAEEYPTEGEDDAGCPVQYVYEYE